MLFNLGFANTTILSCFIFFFLTIDVYFLIPAAIAQICSPIADKYPICVCFKNVFYNILFPRYFLISFGICSTPKLSKYIILLPFTYKAIQ